jgi:hypothetical protein
MGGRHPNFLYSEFGRAFHRVFIETSHMPVEGHSSENGEIGYGLGDLGPVPGDGGVALDQDGFHACPLGLAGHFDVIQEPGVDIRAGMDMKVNDASKHFLRLLF